MVVYIIYQYISFLLFLYTASWSYKRDDLHTCIDILFYVMFYIINTMKKTLSSCGWMPQWTTMNLNEGQQGRSYKQWAGGPGSNRDLQTWYKRVWCFKSLIVAHYGSLWFTDSHLGSSWLILADFGSLWLLVTHCGFSPNKAGFFESSFFYEVGRGVILTSSPPLPAFTSNFKKNSNINITLYNCYTTYLE